MSGFNRTVEFLGDIPFDLQRRDLDLENGEHTMEIRCRLTGTLTVTGVVGDGVLHDDPLQRLIDSIKLKWDNFDIIAGVALRDLYQFDLLGSQAEDTPILPVVNAAGTTPFELNFSLFFARPWNLSPYDTHLPPLPSNKPLRLFIDWASAGADAMIASGTDGYTFGTNPNLRVEQVFAPRSIEPSFFLPVYEAQTVKPWSAATATLAHRLENNRMFDAFVLRATHGASEILENSINTVSFLGSGRTWWDDRPLATLQSEARRAFPAFAPRPTGRFAARMSDFGQITGRFIPAQHSNPRFEFDVATPATPDGLITIVQSQVVGVAKVTKQGL
jgi:hypothetical protein